MKFVTLATALAALLPATVALTINTPSSVVECEPTLLTWTATQSPYYLSAIAAGQTASAPLEQIASGLNTTSYTWTVNLGAGTNIDVAVKDGLGNVAYTSLITIQSGGGSCSNSTPPSTAGSSGATPTGSGSGSSSGSTAGSSGPSSSATTTASGSSSSSTSTKSNGAGRLSVSSAIGVAGIMGLVGAALF